MKKYEYVHVYVDARALRHGGSRDNGRFYTANYHDESRIRTANSDPLDIIDEYADKGYSYVGCIPTHINNSGLVSEMDLIFEIAEC
jgi:hypothetical protein